MWILNIAKKDGKWLFKMHNAKDLSYTRMNDKKNWTKKQIFMGIPNSWKYFCYFLTSNVDKSHRVSLWNEKQ